MWIISFNMKNTASSSPDPHIRSLQCSSRLTKYKLKSYQMVVSDLLKMYETENIITILCLEMHSLRKIIFSLSVQFTEIHLKNV